MRLIELFFLVAVDAGLNQIEGTLLDGTRTIVVAHPSTSVGRLDKNLHPFVHYRVWFKYYHPIVISAWK